MKHIYSWWKGLFRGRGLMGKIAVGGFSLVVVVFAAALVASIFSLTADEGELSEANSVATADAMEDSDLRAIEAWMMEHVFERTIGPPPQTSTPKPTRPPKPTGPPRPTEPPKPTEPQPGAAVNLKITAIHYRGDKGQKEPDEYVEFRNTGGQPIQLDGWILHDDGTQHIYIFSAFELQPGQTCRVYTNKVPS